MSGGGEGAKNGNAIEYFYCLFCKKPIGPIKTWQNHTAALLHRFVPKMRESEQSEN